MDDIGLVAAAVAASTNNALDASTALPIAQSIPNVGQAVQAAQATQSFKETQYVKGRMVAQDSATQRKIWQGLSPQQQQLLSSSGYNVPKAEESGIVGLLHRTVVDIGQGIGDALHGTGLSYIPQALSNIGNVAQSPWRAVTHEFRAYEQLHEEASPGQSGIAPHSTNWAMAFSPSDWARAWRETNKGQQSFLPHIVAEVKKQYGDDTYNLAYKLASNMPATEHSPANSAIAPQLIAQSPDKKAMADRLQTDTNLRDAVNHLQSGAMSLGRTIVGPDFIYHHPLAAQLLSGGIDGTFQWFEDPTLHIVEGAKELNAARYAINTPEDVLRLSSKPSVLRAFQVIGSHVAEGNERGLVDTFPQLAPLTTQLFANHIDSAPKVAEFFAGQVGMANILSGDPTSTASVLGMSLPHLSWSGQTRLSTALRASIDYLADTPARIKGIEAMDTIEQTLQVGNSRLSNLTSPIANTETAVGRFLRALTTIVPSGEFDPYNRNAPTALHNALLIGLPRANADTLVNAFVTADTLPTKADIYMGAMKELHFAMGLGDTAEGTQIINKFMADLQESILNANYSFEDNAKMLEGSRSYNVPVLDNQAPSSWLLPSAKDLYSASKQVSIARSTFGLVNNTWFEALMQRAWKPLTLLRLGFPIRAGGEEAFNSIIRNGPASYLKAQLARSILTHAENEDAGLWYRLTGHLPESVRNAINTPADLMGAIFRDRFQRAGLTLGENDNRYINIALRNDAMSSPLLREISAGEGRAGGYMDDGASVAKTAQDGKVTPVRFVEGPDIPIKPADPSFHWALAKTLDDIAKSDWGRIALENQALPYRQRVMEVADTLEKDQRWLASERAIKTPSGSQVSTGEIPQRVAALNSAERIVKHVDYYTTSATNSTSNLSGKFTGVRADPYNMASDANLYPSKPVPELREFLLNNRKSPTIPALAQIPIDQLPAGALGPDIIATKVNLIENLTRRGFDTLVGRPMDVISRQPMFWSEYLKTWHGFNAEGGLLSRLAQTSTDPIALEDGLHEIAMQRAFDNTVPFIHNPEVRSQLATITRNLMPFYFAQEQFLKRWIRTFAYSPDALRRAQLLFAGIQHSGIVHRDPATGQDYVVYPATGAVQDLLGHVYSMLGHKNFLPIPHPDFQGQLQYMSAGTERLGLPSFGPLASIALGDIVNKFPELSSSQTAILGARGSGRSFLDQILPTTLSRVIHTMLDDPHVNAQYATAYNQVIAMMEAGGHGLPESATLKDKRDWFARVNNYTRTLMLTRTLIGFGAPASPTLQVDPAQYDQKFTKLITELGYKDGFAEFIKLYPDAKPHTVFQSQSTSGAVIPSTQPALDFMTAHKSFLEDYPYAGAWFIPASNGKFSPDAYKFAIAEELRTRRSPEQFYNDLKYTEDAPAYFAAEAKKNTLLHSLRGSQATEVRRLWTEQSQNYLLTHPVFAAGLNGNAADPLALSGAQLRAQALAQLQVALQDHRLPQSPQTNDIRTLINSYLIYKSLVDQFSGQRTSSATIQRRSVDNAYTSSVLGYVKAHPDVQGLFDKVIRPEISTIIAAAGG